MDGFCNILYDIQIFKLHYSCVVRRILILIDSRVLLAVC